MISYLQQDISVRNKQCLKKLSSKEQYKLIQLLTNLLSAGFQLTDIIAFLKKSQLVKPQYVLSMEDSLLKGRGLADMLAGLGFSDAILTQISLADGHGDIKKTLFNIQNYLKQMTQLKRKTIEVITYPIMLLLFLFVIMLGLRHYLVPQLEETNQITDFLNHFPTYFLGFGLALVLLLGVGWLRWRSQSRLNCLSHLSAFPFWGKLLQQYLTAYYAREWGTLIGQGLELPMILDIMATEKSSLMQELAEDIRTSLLAGQAFPTKVATYPFFKKELSLMIEYGEIKSKLGQELEIYAQESWARFFSQLHQATQFIQPVIFLMIALIIVMIYAAILLPIYQDMGGLI
ncbi:competence type IV pilus assembly protein ComGB [Streptococcus canis]|uniref:competence type IV pilus assembly protein ComGB n=1 Tax=Streptococcus canis TaxID=1329 RepID=UPI00155E8F8A|nr:competence type IV pilus assembly protein ComGB [Streptococcus canis]MDV5973697.1 type II secretion system F family protein [Streptococcus canis]QKG78600.1 type II secretion system F family protein [Streptococcus canis]